MDIRLTQIAKRYRYEWIFRGLDYHFKAGGTYAILGPNGSGKSTLMRVLSGHLSPSKGKVNFSNDKQSLSIDDVYAHISYAAPYIDVIEELTLKESITFHGRFKPFFKGINEEALIDLLGFQRSADKQIRNFSSGMKQRLKLALSICSNTPILLLDEPTTNLDQQGFDWYRELIDRFAKDRLIIVASNVETDYAFCEEKIELGDYK